MDIIKQTHNAQTYTAHEGDRIIVGERVDVSGNLDRVKRMREACIDNAVLGTCTASIPLVAIAQWGQQFGIDLAEVVADDKLLDRCISDYGKFKVQGGYL